MFIKNNDKLMVQSLINGHQVNYYLVHFNNKYNNCAPQCSAVIIIIIIIIDYSKDLNVISNRVR